MSLVLEREMEGIAVHSPSLLRKLYFSAVRAFFGTNSKVKNLLLNGFVLFFSVFVLLHLFF